MERTGIHELSAGYALDALTAEERREFEEHLAHCDECRVAVAEFLDTTAALAHGVEAFDPPPALRERIVGRARSERQNVVPLRPRWARPAAAAAAVAACAALAFGIWAATLHNQLGDRPQAIALDGADGTLIVTPAGDGTLVVRNLAAAPSGKTYEAWVIDGGNPRPAGLFSGGGDRTAVALSEPVPDDASVAVTVEDAGGAPQPTGTPIFSAGS